jgi:DNA invertase Pin-like site-specific DNA recombinase
LSLDTQIDSLEAEAERRGWQIQGRYRDTISGSVAAFKRPAFRQLLGAIRRGEADTVAVVRLDRLTRSTKDTLHTLDELKKLGVSVVSLNEPMLSTEGPQSTLLLTIFAAVNEFERALLKQRCDEGRKSAKARGVKFGRKEIKLDPEKVSSMRAEGLSVRQIARELGVSVGKVHATR